MAHLDALLITFAIALISLGISWMAESQSLDGKRIDDEHDDEAFLYYNEWF